MKTNESTSNMGQINEDSHVLPREGNYMLKVMQINGWDKRSQFDKSGEEVTLSTVTNVKEVFVWWGYSLYFHKGENELLGGVRWW